MKYRIQDLLCKLLIVQKSNVRLVVDNIHLMEHLPLIFLQSRLLIILHRDKPEPDAELLQNKIIVPKGSEYE